MASNRALVLQCNMHSPLRQYILYFEGSHIMEMLSDHFNKHEKAVPQITSPYPYRHKMSKFFHKARQKARRIFPRSDQIKPDLIPTERVSSPVTKPNEIDSEHNEGKHGLFVLVNKPRDQVGGIDIVALHGLNGHYKKTWSAPLAESPQHYNWLEDALPKEIPTARIMSFGYDSAVFSKSVADISDFAEQLLEELLVKRYNPEERKRPLLFLCHSLGGIVFKKALIRARERDRYEELLRMVRGVAFFGTPHQGSKTANWGTIIANILNAASFELNMNTTLINNLEKQSGVLFEISESFVDRGKGLKITSFYETRKLGGTNFVVVPKSSALLIVANETPVPLNGDHRSICRFSNTGEDKARLQLVMGKLKTMVDDAVSRDATFVPGLSPRQLKHCLKELYPGDYESFKDFNVTRTPGTCEWFLRHNEYLEWRNEKQSCLLWVSANAGCGKSTLAKFLVDHLRTSRSPPNSSSESICHFFFKEGIHGQHNTVLALRAILHQIISRDKALSRHLVPEYKAKGSRMMAEFNSLFKVLRDIISDPESTNIVCVLDGLDECSQTDTTNFLRAINEFYKAQEDRAISKRTQQGSCLMPYLKFVVLSRPENLIKNAFRKYQYTIRLKGEDETKAISHDIALVIRKCIEDLEEDMNISQMVLKDFSEGLIAGADNTFLWVTLMIKILRDRHQSQGGTSKRELVDLLRGRDIFTVYHHMLKNITVQSKSLKMLQIIVAAQTPLSIDQMNIALAVTSSHNTLEDVALDVKYPAEDYVKALCGHFVRFNHGKIYLVHQTALEFLVQQSQVNSLINNTWQHSIAVSESHRTLLRTCILYISCGEKSAWDESVSLADPRLKYTARNNSISPNATVRVIQLNVRGSMQDPIEFKKLASVHPLLLPNSANLFLRTLGIRIGH
ncbi:hypothetical protein F4819DRAFT_320439 [Hypoxylon fuscum]|nr:hypothetical protein F4819DRAFT_320439 [Hypoxylon fuscum]